MTTVVRIEVSPVSWWRPLVQWLLCIPHLLLTGAMAVASVAIAFLIAPIVLLTGKAPARLVAFQVTSLRERVRCYAYFFVLRESRPPYALAPRLRDPADDPLVEVSASPPERMSRWALLARPFVVLPHLLVLVPIGVVMDVCYPVWMLLVAANRGWPAGLERLLIQIEAWVTAVALYALFVTDEAPRFGMAAYGDPVAARPPLPSSR